MSDSHSRYNARMGQEDRRAQLSGVTASTAVDPMAMYFAIFKLVVVGGQVLYQLFLLSWKQKFQDILNFSTFQCMNYFPFCLVLFVFCLRNLCLLPYCKMFWIFFQKHYCFIFPFYFYNPSGIACSLWCKVEVKTHFFKQVISWPSSIHWNDRLVPVSLQCHICHISGIFIGVDLFLGSSLFLSLSLGSSGCGQ